MNVLKRRNRAKELLAKREAEARLVIETPPQMIVDVTIEQPLTDLASLSVVIKICRKKRGITQQSLADYAGVGRKFIIELERGEKETLEIGKVLQVCKILGIDLTTKYNP